MEPDTAAKRAIALGEFIETLKGKRVRVIQLISWRPGSGFERHSTVRSDLSFLVTDTMWVMSGGHYVLYGEKEFQYSIGTTMLRGLQVVGNKVEATEIYGDGAERRSTVEVVEEDA